MGVTGELQGGVSACALAGMQFTGPVMLASLHFLAMLQMLFKESTLRHPSVLGPLFSALSRLQQATEAHPWQACFGVQLGLRARQQHWFQAWQLQGQHPQIPTLDRQC